MYNHHTISLKVIIADVDKCGWNEKSHTALVRMEIDWKKIANILANTLIVHMFSKSSIPGLGISLGNKVMPRRFPTSMFTEELFIGKHCTS